MNIELVDHMGSIINIGDIVKREHLISSTETYYILKKDDNGMYLHKYSSDENAAFNYYINIHVASGVTLANDDIWRWTRIGPEENINQ